MTIKTGGAMPRLGDGSPSIDLAGHWAEEGGRRRRTGPRGIQRSTGLTAMEHSLAATPFEV
jgi:hypothetical protein